MPRAISLATREQLNSPADGATLIVLAILHHPEMTDGPWFLASDWTERLSDDPLRIGLHHQGTEFEFVLMSAVLPDDQDGSPATCQLTFDAVVSDLSRIARSVTSPATIDLRVIRAEAPDVIEEEYLGLKVTHSSYSETNLTVDISRESIVNEPWLADVMTRRWFPALYR